MLAQDVDDGVGADQLPGGSGLWGGGSAGALDRGEDAVHHAAGLCLGQSDARVPAALQVVEEGERAGVVAEEVLRVGAQVLVHVLVREPDALRDRGVEGEGGCVEDVLVECRGGLYRLVT